VRNVYLTKGRPVKKAKTEKKPMGRPRKHSVSAITCVVKLPPEVVRWIDARYTTRQEGLAAIVAEYYEGAMV
jgi:hypothetical protein